MQPTLLVLAAGMGSRYGGLKQFEPVGPAGETLLDYAVFDAVRAGFGRAVFVIQEDFATAFREKVAARYEGRIAIDVVFQSLDALPPGAGAPSGRGKPWGTGHAVWCAHEAVRENFAVINADDFYGEESLRRLAEFLRGAGERRSPAGASEYAMVGFRLGNTLSEHGAVSRGICRTNRDGKLEAIVERTGIGADNVGPGREFTGDEIVSMNCWGFTPAVFAGLDRHLRDFLANRGTDPKSEFYLPAAVSAMIACGEATAGVLTTASEWFGVTYREDRPRVAAAIAALVRREAYPPKLF